LGSGKLSGLMRPGRRRAGGLLRRPVRRRDDHPAAVARNVSERPAGVPDRERRHGRRSRSGRRQHRPSAHYRRVFGRVVDRRRRNSSGWLGFVRRRGPDPRRRLWNNRPSPDTGRHDRTSARIRRRIVDRRHWSILRRDSGRRIVDRWCGDRRWREDGLSAPAPGIRRKDGLSASAPDAAGRRPYAGRSRMRPFGWAPWIHRR
jgi:hypothetical protein